MNVKAVGIVTNDTFLALFKSESLERKGSRVLFTDVLPLYLQVTLDLMTTYSSMLRMGCVRHSWYFLMTPFRHPMFFFLFFWKLRALQLSLLHLNLFQNKQVFFFFFLIHLSDSTWTFIHHLRCCFVSFLRKILFVLRICAQLPLLFQFYTTSFKIFIWVLLYSLTQGTRFGTFEKSCSVTCWSDRVFSQY